MSETHTTSTAARTANVTTKTIRTWCRNGSVSATKTNGRWAIDADSLNGHLATRIAREAARIVKHADFAPYKDQAKARDNVYNLLADGALIPLIEAVYLVVSKTDENKTYIVNTADQTCDCKGHLNWGRCSHRTAANAIEASKGATSPALALAA